MVSLKSGLFLDGAPTSIVEMMFNTNIIAVVGKNDKGDFTSRRLSLWDTVGGCSRMDMSYTSQIEFVKINKFRYFHLFIFILG